jgi:hypothetical protein
MEIADIKALMDATVTKEDGVTVPAFEVKVIPGPDSFPDLLRYSYNVTNMTATTMTLNLTFENPVDISAFDIDTLKIIFNDP